MKQGWTRVRVCNSDDHISTEEKGNCRAEKGGRNSFNYTEVRIGIGPWDSIQYEAWILQILLSEILDVPTSTESGHPDVNLNFYNLEDTSRDAHHSGKEHYAPLKKAAEVGDCRKLRKNNDIYEPCAHIWTEVFHVSSKLKSFVADKIIDYPQGLGVVAQEGWYIPKFTADRNPSLLTFTGYQGNRKKLAETFLRPTTWKEYCRIYSPTGCWGGTDKVAKRAPIFPEENKKMFVEGVYTGHFHTTKKNNCTQYPDTCTGHIVNYPCSSVTYVKDQVRYHAIPLESDGDEPGSGYQAQQMKDIWRAANATKSNVVMLWWDTDPLFREFMGSEAEFKKVYFPPATQECVDARHAKDEMDRCSHSNSEAAGMCDQASTCLKKLISTGLHDDDAISMVAKSPAYEALQLFTIDELQMSEIFENFQHLESHRKAACQWVVDNFDILTAGIPKEHPRRIVTRSRNHHHYPWLHKSSLIFGIITSGVVLLTGVLVYINREKQEVKKAQIDFLCLILAGSFFISIGSILEVAPVDNSSCITATWLVHFGYTLEFSPLIVKVSAINKITSAAKKLNKVLITRNVLYVKVAFVCSIAIIFLILVTVLDPKELRPVYVMQSERHLVENEGIVNYLVEVEDYCSSKSSVLNYLAVAWNSLLLLCTTVLTVQMRGVRKDFNEVLSLSVMIYSHFLFLILRLANLAVEANLEEPGLTYQFQTLLYSLDTLAAVVIYFGPKFVEFDKKRIIKFRVNKSSTVDVTYSKTLGARDKSKYAVKTSLEHRPTRAMNTDSHI